MWWLYALFSSIAAALGAVLMVGGALIIALG